MGDGHLSETVETVYSGVVSLRTLRLVIFLVELSNLEIWGGDIGNALLDTYPDEKLCIVVGPDFKELQQDVLIIRCALYGTLTGGAR